VPRADVGGAGLRAASSTVFDVLVNQVLQVEPSGADRFVGTHPADSFDRVYGGEVAAQGLCAASRTVAPGREVHSLHVSFLRIGDPTHPVEYVVGRLRDSTQFSTRQVSAEQAGRPIAAMTVSFQAPRPGLEHTAPPRGDVPAPDTLARRSDQLAAAFPVDPPASARMPWPIDIRYIDHQPWHGGGDPENRMWLRGDGTLGDDPLVHACVLTYASDLTMFEPVAYAHSPGRLTWEQLTRGQVRGASLDHSIWFHRAFRADEWLLHEQVSPSAHGSRGLTTSRFFTAAGDLVASAAQEVALLVEPVRGGGG
jgi:acyl-CoA thioesterase-2